MKKMYGASDQYFLCNFKKYKKKNHKADEIGLNTGIKI